MGSNGLDPVAQWNARQKCPDAPTKKRYTTSEEAWEAARIRTKETGIEIAAYLCPGCGGSHLTKKVDGSDIAVMAPVGVTTGSLRKSFAQGFSQPVERVEVISDAPIIPGNKAAREAALDAYLDGKDEVRSSELVEVMGISAYSAIGVYMRERGWTTTRGRHAKWTRPGSQPMLSVVTPMYREAMASVALDRDQTFALVEASVDRHPAGKAIPQPEKGAEWRPVDLKPMPATTTLKDLFDIYRAAGLEMRIEVRDR